MMKSSSRALSCLSLGGLALVSVLGCQGVITKGGGDGGSGGSGGGDPSETGAGGQGSCDPGACPTEAIVMSHAQYSAAMGEDTSGQLLTNTQYLQYGGGTQTPSCGAPFGGSDCGGWTVSLTIPTDYLTPGIYPFADVDVDIYFTESIKDGADGCMGMGGVGFMDGQIEIVNVTATTVDFKVSGVQESGENFSVNGAFSASRCP